MKRGWTLRVRFGDSVWRLRPLREWRRPRGRAMEVWGRDPAGAMEGYECTELGPFRRLRRIGPSSGGGPRNGSPYPGAG